MLPPAEMLFVDFPPERAARARLRGEVGRRLVRLPPHRAALPRAGRGRRLGPGARADRAHRLDDLRGRRLRAGRHPPRRARAPCVLEVNANPCLSADAGFVAAAAERRPRRRRCGRADARRRWSLAHAATRQPSGRRGLDPADREPIARLLGATGFFNPEELEVAMELVDDRLDARRAPATTGSWSPRTTARSPATPAGDRSPAPPSRSTSTGSRSTPRPRGTASAAPCSPRPRRGSPSRVAGVSTSRPPGAAQYDPDPGLLPRLRLPRRCRARGLLRPRRRQGDLPQGARRALTGSVGGSPPRHEDTKPPPARSPGSGGGTGAGLASPSPPPARPGGRYPVPLRVGTSGCAALTGRSAQGDWGEQPLVSFHPERASRTSPVILSERAAPPPSS